MAIIPTFRGSNKNKQQFSAINLTKKDPKLAAMVTKLERGNNPVVHDEYGNRKTTVTNTHVFKSMLQKRAKRNNDAHAITKLLPDIELSSQILVSSILSPKDMMSVEFIYGGPKSLLSSELLSSMLNRMKEHFEEDYKIKDKVADMLREPLFEKGAYVAGVIPENAIDDIINGTSHVSMEELRRHFTEDGTARNLNILGPHVLPSDGRESKVGIVLENHRLFDAKSIDNRVHYFDTDIPDWSNYSKEEYLIVTDNPNVLKIPKLNAMTKEEVIKKRFSEGGLKSGLEVTFENYSETGRPISDIQIERATYRIRQHQTEPIVTVKHQHSLGRRSVGNPLIIKFPSESVLPVHVPGDVKRQIGFFIILDEEGNPITSPSRDQLHPGLRSDSANSVASNLIKKASMNLGTDGDNFNPLNPIHVSFAQQIFADMVERDLINRVKNGINSSSVNIAHNEEVYRLMLSRVLARKYTQLLYVPVEYMTYIAFKYGDDGIGRSLLDDQAMINTLRTVLMFSDVMASVKNSIGRTKVTGTIPETDPNPMKTIEHMVDEIIRSRTLGIPLGVSNPADVMEFIQRAGYEFEFTGNKGIPDMKFDFAQTNTNFAKPDQELTEHLRKSSIMGFGISPETIDNGFNTEFATTAIANNILLAKRVVMHQDTFVPQLSDHCRKVATHTEDLTNDLREILSNNFDGINIDIEDIDGTSGEQIDDSVKKEIIINKALKDFIAGFNISLPRPSSVTLEAQLSELKNYSDALDVALDSYITSDLFTSTVTGEISNEAGTVRALIKAYFIRKWMADKNVLTELAGLVMADEDGNPQINITDEITSHMEAMTKTGVLTLVKLQPNKAAADADLKNSNVAVGDNSDTSSDSYGESGYGSDNSSDMFGGTDANDGGLGSDLNDGSNTEEDTTNPENTTSDDGNESDDGNTDL